MADVEQSRSTASVDIQQDQGPLADPPSTSATTDSEAQALEQRGNGVPSGKDAVPENSYSNAGPMASTPDKPEVVSKEDSTIDADQQENLMQESEKPASKPAMSVKSVPGKSLKSNAPPTPLVKKIINSGTFGSGSVKPVPPSVSKTAATPLSTTTSKPAAAALKKSTSAPPATTIKTASSIARPSPTKPTITTTVAKPAMAKSATSTALQSSTGPTRRQSMGPKALFPNSSPSKPSVSGSVKPSTNNNGRPASPAPSAASVRSNGPPRPRASISEGLPARKPTIGPRASISAASKPPLSASIKPSRTPGAGSISSVKEVKEDGSAIEELQNKISESEALAASRASKVSELEAQLQALNESLTSATANVNSKQTALDELQQSKYAVEKELAEAKEALQALSAQTNEGLSTLKQVQDALQAAQSDVASRDEAVNNMTEQIRALTSELEAVRGNLAELRSSHDAAIAGAAAAASVEQAALLKAKDDLAAIKVESEALAVAHATALDDTNRRVKAAEEQAARADTLAAELAALKSEREDMASKLSELEVEILELKEAAETAEENHSTLQSRIKALEEDLSKAAAASLQATEGVRLKEEEHANQLNEAKRLQEEAQATASQEHERLLAKLTAMEEELAAATSRHDRAVADASAAGDEHKCKLADLEKASEETRNNLELEIERLAKDLEGQEAQYNAKVDAVKAEHDQLLQEAFEKAKTAAGDVHSQELQILRTQSQSTIEQLRTAHQSEIDSIKDEHHSALESQVKSLEKTISNQSLELKATQDDLSKAKAALAASIPEMEALKTQLKEANEAAAGLVKSASTAQAAEVERLNKELSMSRDDLAALDDMLKLTRQSLKETSDNHEVELRETAKARADEAIKLKSAHNAESARLVAERDSLAVRVSDLEGEIATLRAAAEAAAAEAAALPKTNGSAHNGHPTVTAEELQRMHEAHNLRLRDLEAGYDKSLKSVREELQLAHSKSEDLNNEVSRKTLEIQYLEQDGEEKDDTITRLKEDIANLSEQLAQLKADQTTEH